jgi:hypothetical protein
MEEERKSEGRRGTGRGGLGRTVEEGKQGKREMWWAKRKERGLGERGGVLFLFRKSFSLLFILGKLF